MNYKVFAPHDCHIEVELPASKSISNRALVINALCEDSIPITNVSDCDDTRVMKQAFTEKNSSIDIHGAGTAMRFLFFRKLGDLETSATHFKRSGYL